MVPKIPDKYFFKIGEVAKLAEVEPYVLRYWETEFEWLNPEKNRKNQRVYSRKDVELVLLIHLLLHKNRYTIEGARMVLRDLNEDWAAGFDMRFDRPDAPQTGAVTGAAAPAGTDVMSREIEQAKKKHAQAEKDLKDAKLRGLEAAAALAEERKQHDLQMSAALAEERKKNEQQMAAALAEERKKNEQQMAATLAEIAEHVEAMKALAEEEEGPRPGPFIGQGN